MNVRLPLQIAVWVYCLSWAFDYRAAADSGGSPGLRSDLARSLSSFFLFFASSFWRFSYP